MAIAFADMDLERRIIALIRRYFGGNALEAARKWGVSQPTVHRLATGKTTSPRASTLGRIARYHDTTIEALLYGKGPDPLVPGPMPIVEYREFRDVVDRLDLDPETRYAVLSLPTTIGAAHSILCEWRTSYEGEFVAVPPRVSGTAQDAAWKAAAMTYSAWAHFLDGLIRAYGKSRVREKLQSELNRIRLGFHPIGIDMLYRKGVPDLLESTVEGRPSGREWAGVKQLDAPAQPPLNELPADRRKPRRGRPWDNEPHYRYDEDTNATD